jgi:endonuclease III
LPLDEHPLRVARRLGYGKAVPLPAAADAPAVKVVRLTRQALQREAGRDPATLRRLTQYFTHHGLSTCTETAPHCGVCPLAYDCEWLRRQ